MEVYATVKDTEQLQQSADIKHHKNIGEKEVCALDL